MEGNDMIGYGVKDDSGDDNPYSNDGDSDSENKDENSDSGDSDSENDDDENSDSGDSDSENEDEEHDWWPDWCGDTNPSDISIGDDDTICWKIKGDLNYLKNGDIELNGKIYKSDKLEVVDDYIFERYGMFLRNNGIKLYLVNGMLFQECGDFDNTYGN